MLAPLGAMSFLVACSRGASDQAESRQAVPVNDVTQPASSKPATGEPATPATEFNRQRAFDLLRAQCDFGPRPPGSAAHDKCRDFLVAQLRPLVDEIITQNWTQPIKRGPGAGRSFAMTNILGVIRGTAAGGAPPGGKDTADAANTGPSLMLCAHWDTRPVADQDPSPANRAKPILGANDAASGVATLLEVARVLKRNRPSLNVIIAFWDGEDLGEFFYGSRYFARMSSTPAWKRWRPDRAILIDMIGDRDLQCNRETNSLRYAPDLYQEVLNAAAGLGLSRHFDGPQMEVQDDHLPLNQAGIPAIDLIDFSYPAWHTVDDTPDKCSPESLSVIGRVLLRVIATSGRV